MGGQRRQERQRAGRRSQCGGCCIDFCIVLVGGQRRQERQRAGRRSQCGGCCIDFCVKGEVGGGEEEVRWR